MGRKQWGQSWIDWGQSKKVNDAVMKVRRETEIKQFPCWNFNGRQMYKIPLVKISRHFLSIYAYICVTVCQNLSQIKALSVT